MPSNEAIEALLRAVDDTVASGRLDYEDAIGDLAEAAAAVRAELAQEPVPDGELLPCPFCGDRVIRDRVNDEYHDDISCATCGDAFRMTDECWNRRAELARGPVELSDEELHAAFQSGIAGAFDTTTDGLRAVARAARGEK